MTASETPRGQQEPEQSATSPYRVTKREAIYAARTKVIIDKKRGRTTEQWIKDLANEDDLTA